MVTEKVLMAEFRRGAELLYAGESMAEVCCKIDFFSSFSLFIEMDVIGSNSTKEDQKDYKDFQGLVESRILKLLTIIQKFYRKEIEEGTFQLVPFPKMFKKK